MLHSETEAHLVNLERCGGRQLQRAYLAVLLAAERAGYTAVPRGGGESPELHIRDTQHRTPFVLTIAADALLFELRRPALDARPELAGQAQLRFPGRLSGSIGSGTLSIRLTDDRQADELTDWLLGGGAASAIRAAAERWFG